MSYEILKKENSEVTIKVTVAAEEFEKAIVVAYNKNKGKFNIPGFRKGKAPRSIIEKQYGEGTFFEDAVNSLLPVHYEKALDALSIDPVARPDIDIEEVAPKSDLVFTAVVTVAPEFTLEGYKGIEVEDINAEVTDKMIDDEIEKTRNMNARLVSVTRPIQNEDTATIDYKGFVGDHQFEGGTAENQELVIGSGKFIPGFEEQLIGAKIGDHVHVNVTFPEVYHSDELAGKEAVFHVSVNDIKFKELPAVDDEFAKDVSEFDTLEAYKSNMKAELEVSAAESAKAARRDKVIDKVSELITVEIPAKMIESEIDGMIKEFDQQLRQQGLSMDQYVQFTGGNIDALREQMRVDALARVKTSLVIEKVMVQENIEVTEADVDTEIEKIADMQKRDAGEIRKLFEKDNYDYLKSNLKSRKTVDFLLDNAKFI